MKFFAIAVFLALLALTQAKQNESNQGEVSQSVLAPTQNMNGSNQAEQFNPDSLPRPVEDERPLRSRRPGRPLLIHHLPLRQTSEEQNVENKNAVNHPNQGQPPRQVVAFDIKFDFGQENQIYED